MASLTSSTSIQALERLAEPASELGMAATAALKPSQTPLQALAKCLPRLTVALSDTFPRGPGTSSCREPGVLLPREAGIQQAVSQLLAKLTLCLPACRLPILA